VIRWQLERYLRRPPTVRRAAAVIVTMTALVVIVSALLMRLLDKKDFPTMGRALWWALQTATTVGYGDAVPHTRIGYIVGGVVMLEGIAFLAIITASITSTFVARAERELGAFGDKRWEEVVQRLGRIEQALGIDGPPESPPSNDAPTVERLLNPGEEPRHRRVR
jgi:hypothetical protein